MSKKKQCEAIKQGGDSCQAAAGESGYCFAHDPERGQERAIARRKGGAATRSPHYGDKETVPAQIRSIEQIFTVLDYALAETLGLSNGIQRGRLLVSIAHGYLEAVKVGEQEERLAAVEAALKIRRAEKRARDERQKSLRKRRW